LFHLTTLSIAKTIQIAWQRDEVCVQGIREGTLIWEDCSTLRINRHVARLWVTNISYTVLGQNLGLTC